MKTSQENKESELLSRNAHSISGTSEGPRKWILYTIGSDPLLGFVHASSEAEALGRVAAFKLPVIAVPANAPAIDANGMTPERIARTFALFGSIIPAYSETHRRTSYFYRKQAVEWAKMARQWWPTKDFAGLCRRLAKRYLALYREAKTTAV